MEKTTINAAALHAALDGVRKSRGISWRKLAGEVGVSPSLFSRLGNGLRPDADGFATIVAWLEVPAEVFFDRPESGREKGAEPELMSQLAPLLRARRDLTDSDITYLEQVIRATLERAQARE